MRRDAAAIGTPSQIANLEGLSRSSALARASAKSAIAIPTRNHWEGLERLLDDGPIEYHVVELSSDAATIRPLVLGRPCAPSADTGDHFQSSSADHLFRFKVGSKYPRIDPQNWGDRGGPRCSSERAVAAPLMLNVSSPLGE